jgi:hypothetical protein
VTEEQRELIERDRQEALALASQILRWFLASLLLVHGAALIGLLNAVDKLPPAALLATKSFAAGLIAALGAGGLAGIAASSAAGRFYFELRGNRPFATLGFLTQLGCSVIGFVMTIISVFSFAVGILQVTDAVAAARKTASGPKPGLAHGVPHPINTRPGNLQPLGDR